MHILHLVLKSR